MAHLVKKQQAPNEESYLPISRLIADSAANKKAKDIKAYDVRDFTVMADCFLLCTTTSEPQMKAVLSAVREDMREAGRSPLNVEGTHHDGWVLMDYGEVIVHIFREKAREFYDLDGMWADAPVLALDVEL